VEACVALETVSAVGQSEAVSQEFAHSAMDNVETDLVVCMSDTTSILWL
jgi:hypothetical protein